MPDELPDIRQPWADLGHEAIRQAVLAALNDLTDHVEQLADAFLVGETAADGLTIALQNFVLVQQAVSHQAEQIADLQAQVAALTQTPAP